MIHMIQELIEQTLTDLRDAIAATTDPFKEEVTHVPSSNALPLETMAFSDKAFLARRRQ
jgi:hypothetical protein